MPFITLIFYRPQFVIHVAIIFLYPSPIVCGIWTWSLVVVVCCLRLCSWQPPIGYTSTNTHMTGRDRRGLDWSICGHSLGGIIIIIIVLVVLFCLSTPLSPNGQHPYNSPPHHNHPIDQVLLLPAYYGKDMTMGYTSPQLNYPLALGSVSLSLLFCCCWK